MLSSLVVAVMICFVTEIQQSLEYSHKQLITKVKDMKKALFTALWLAIALGSSTASAKWDPDEAKEYDEKAQVALTEFKEKDPKVQRFIDESAGYVVIPTVGKGGIGIGGARGKGVLYEGEAVDGRHNSDAAELWLSVGRAGLQRVHLL